MGNAWRLFQKYVKQGNVHPYEGKIHPLFGLIVFNSETMFTIKDNKLKIWDPLSTPTAEMLGLM